jgi:hypothetical protein
MKVAAYSAALIAAIGLVGCSNDTTRPAPADGPIASSSAPGNASGGSPSSPDTLGGAPHGEWHLQTIRGAVLGLDRSAGIDTSVAAATPIANATIEIHKISLAIVPPSGSDTATAKLKDLGIVATATTDASGRFEYVISEPLIVKTGEPSPLITYHLTIIPPAGSSFVGQSDVQVFFAEQLPGDGVFHYYLFHPKS